MARWGGRVANDWMAFLPEGSQAARPNEMDQFSRRALAMTRREPDVLSR